MQPGGPQYGKEDPFGEVSDFDDELVRKNFVSKVYGILAVQMVFSSGVIFGVTYDEEVREWFYDRQWMTIIFAVLGLLAYLALACCEPVRRSFPCNFVLLGVMTLGYAGMAAGAAAMYEVIVVYLAFGATGLITILMTLVAKFAPCDVTGCGFFFCVAFIALGVLSLVAMVVSFFIHIPLIHLIISCVSVLILSFYLVFITQLIMGGKKGEISPDEVILAVIILYVTIIEIFIHLLVIIQACFGE